MLTKLFRKRGTGQGAVQESNPAIAQREYKSPAQEPHLGINGIGSHISQFADAINDKVRYRGGNIDFAIKKTNEDIRKGMQLHGEKKFSEAATAFERAHGNIAHHVTGGSYLIDHKAQIFGQNKALLFHKNDIEASLKDYADKAKAWHAENPAKPSEFNTDLLKDI
jgi:hypothetical protein